MNLNSRALAAVLLNAGYVSGGCFFQPDADGVVKIPDTWMNIPERAFMDCNDLKKVTIPKKITAIYTDTFYIEYDQRGYGLEVVEFEAESQLVSIGSYAFGSTDIKSIVIPKSVTEILSQAFAFSQLEVVEFEADSELKSIETEAFYWTNIRSINIPKGVTLGTNAFFSLTSCPTSVILPGNNVVDCKITPRLAPTTLAPMTSVPSTPPTTPPQTIVEPPSPQVTDAPTIGPNKSAPPISAPTISTPATSGKSGKKGKKSKKAKFGGKYSKKKASNKKASK